MKELNMNSILESITSKIPELDIFENMLGNIYIETKEHDFICLIIKVYNHYLEEYDFHITNEYLEVYSNKEIFKGYDYMDCTGSSFKDIVYNFDNVITNMVNTIQELKLQKEGV